MQETQFTYAQAASLLRIWFMSRGGDLLANPETLLTYLNLTIQDIYNEDNATFTYETETLTGVRNGDNMVFTTTFPIHKIQLASSWNSTFTERYKDLSPALYNPACDEIVFKDKQILADTDVEYIKVVYVREYTWASFPDDLSKIVPLPKRYLPTLMKLSYDWASPINLMASEQQTTDFYGHGMTRLNKLAASDGVTDNYKLNSAY